MQKDMECIVIETFLGDFLKRNPKYWYVSVFMHFDVGLPHPPSCFAKVLLAVSWQKMGAVWSRSIVESDQR